MSELSSQEVAERIGVSMSTLKNWAVRLPVPSTLGPDGTRRFPEEALAVLEAVKHLRDEERSYETIRRTILPQPTLVELDVVEVERVARGAACEAAVQLTAMPPADTAGAPCDEMPEPLATASVTQVAGSVTSEPVDAPAIEAGTSYATAPADERPSTPADVELPSAVEAQLERLPETAPSQDLAVVMARVLEVLGEQNGLAEAYATSRQRIGELEMALRVAHDDRVRLQAELAEARHLLGQGELAAARRKPWWLRYFDFGQG